MSMTNEQINAAFQKALREEPPPPAGPPNNNTSDEPVSITLSRILPSPEDVDGWTKRVLEALETSILNWNQAVIAQFANYQGTSGATRYATWGSRAKQAHEKALRARLTDVQAVRSLVSFALQCMRAWSPITLARFVIVKSGELALGDILPEFTAKFEKPDPVETPRFTEGLPQPEESAKIHEGLKKGQFGNKKPMVPNAPNPLAKIQPQAKLDPKIEAAIKAAEGGKE